MTNQTQSPFTLPVNYFSLLLGKPGTHLLCTNVLHLVGIRFSQTSHHTFRLPVVLTNLIHK